MLTIHEEKDLYFPNHSWPEFQQMYINRVANGTKGYNALLQCGHFDSNQLTPIAKTIHSWKLRLAAIDTYMAEFCDVRFIEVKK